MRKTIVSLVCVAAMLLALVVAGPFANASPATSEGNGGEAGIAPGGHGLGLDLSRPDPKYKLDTSKLGTGMPLAASVDLSADLPPVGDQRTLQSCVGWATGYYYKSWWEKQEHPSWDLTNDKYNFSPAFIYNQINGGVDGGSTIYDAMQLLQDTGDCDYKEFPFVDDYQKQPTFGEKQVAKQYRIPDSSSDGWGYFFAEMTWGPYTRGNVITELKAHLNSGEPLVMGIPIYADFPDWGGTPQSDYYDYDGSSPLQGGHAVFIAGYDDNANPGGATPETRGGFLLVNSWGSGWNGNGEVWISYKFVKQWVPEAWFMEDRDSSPKITAIIPLSAAPGNFVTISGTNFGYDRRSAEVTFAEGGSGAAPGAGEGTVKSWTNSQIQVYVPGSAVYGNVHVYDWNGERSNGKSFNPESQAWLMAEGATWPGFGEWVLVMNPNTADAAVQVEFLTPDGPVTGPEYLLPAQSRLTVNVNEFVPNQDVATVVSVTNDVTVCAERAMYINTNDGKWGSHDSIAFPGVSDVWYLAEGATWPGYDEWVLVMNPNDEPVDVRVTFQTPFGEVAGPLLELAGGTRESVHVNDIVPNQDVSTKVQCLTSAKGVVAERSMYVRTADGKLGCHNSVGSHEASAGWALAEGATWPGFEEWVLVQNPSGTAVPVSVFFLTPTELLLGPEFTVAPGSRESICVNHYLLNEDVSTMVLAEEEDQEIVVERAMYINTPEGKVGAHNSPGSVYISTGWYLPEGCTSLGFDEWVLVMNPDPDITANVQLTFMTPEGPLTGPATTLAPGARESFNINNYYVGDVSTKVESDQYVVSERAMYVGTPDGKCGAHCSLGVLAAFVSQGSGGSGASALPAEMLSTLRERYCR